MAVERCARWGCTAEATWVLNFFEVVTAPVCDDHLDPVREYFEHIGPIRATYIGPEDRLIRVDGQGDHAAD